MLFAKDHLLLVAPDNSQAGWEVPVQRILGRLSYLLQQKQQLLLKTAPFWNNVNGRKVHISSTVKRRDHGFAPPVFADKGDALFLWN